MYDKMHMLFIIMAALCMAYYLAVGFSTGSAAGFSLFWVFLGGCFAILSWMYGKRGVQLMPGWIRSFCTVCVLLGILLIGTVSIRILVGAYEGEEKETAYCIVLGAKVNGKSPSRALRYRLEKALEYSERCHGTKLILSGGQGSNEEISEAECMKNWLLARNVPEDRLIPEDRSTSTEENLLFSDQKTGCRKQPAAIVTNDFHVYRAKVLARELGFEDVIGLAARSDLTTKPHYLAREAAALIWHQVRKRTGQ